MSYVIFGRPNCSYCTKAKDLLIENEKPYLYIDISLNPQAKEFMLKAGATEVPQIFHKFHHIGGFTELVKFIDSY